MKIKIDIPEKDLAFVQVPNPNSKYKIFNYGFAGSYLMENDEQNLNGWKMKLPEGGEYEALGFVKDVVDEEIEIDANYVLRKIR